MDLFPKNIFSDIESSSCLIIYDSDTNKSYGFVKLGKLIDPF